MRRDVGVTVVLAGLVLAAGCGGSSKSTSGGGTSAAPKDNALDAVKASYSSTLAAKTSKFDMDVSISGAGGRNQSIKGSGVVDYTTRRSQLTLTTSSGTIPLIQDGNVVYLKRPGASSTGKPWFKFDASKFTGGSSGNSDPSAALQYLVGVSDQVKKVGQETVRGEPTTKYTAVIDLDKVAAQRPQAASGIRQLEAATKTKTLPVDVWLDAKHRVRKLTENLDLSVNGQQAHESATLEAYDFGTPVNITLPPPGQVSSVSSAG